MTDRISLLDQLNQRRYDPNKEPQPEQFILKIGGRRVGSLQNLVTLSGKQKQGKSRYVAAAIAASITGADIFGISVNTPQNRPRVALFDTEQGDFDFYKQIKQIKQLAGINKLPAHFDAFTLREDGPLGILKMMKAYLEENPDCSLIFIDGILDLLLDFNNVPESKKLINFLKLITKKYNCLAVSVMHRGKGNDTNLGNIGSMVDRLAQSVIKVEKTEAGTFRMAPEFMRSDTDFDPIEIFYNGSAWAQCYGAPAETPAPAPVRKISNRPADIDALEHRQNVETIFSIGDFLTYDQLITGIKEIYGCGKSWAADCAKHLRFEGLIYRTGDGWTNRKQTKIKGL